MNKELLRTLGDLRRRVGFYLETALQNRERRLRFIGISVVDIVLANPRPIAASSSLGGRIAHQQYRTCTAQEIPMVGDFSGHYEGIMRLPHVWLPYVPLSSPKSLQKEAEI